MKKLRQPDGVPFVQYIPRARVGARIDLPEGRSPGTDLVTVRRTRTVQSIIRLDGGIRAYRWRAVATAVAPFDYLVTPCEWADTNAIRIINDNEVYSDWV